MSTDRAVADVQRTLPLMLELAQFVDDPVPPAVNMGAMTKYKTFNGEEIDGAKVWNYDFHDDDD